MNTQSFQNVITGVALFFCAQSSGQPQPQAKEILAIESTSFACSVPEQKDLIGGHLQGIQLHNETLFVSGSSKEFGFLGLFQKLGDDFRFIGLKRLATNPLNHAGGFQIAENWLAIGLEDPVGKRESIVQLIDISSFEKLQKPPAYTLRRKGEYQFSTAGAVAILKRKDHFLLAIGTWDCTTIDFYTSNNLNPYSKGFEFEKWTTWDSREAIRRKWVDKKFGNYQNLQLTQDSTGVYITGFCRAGNGSNRADVYRMDTDADPYTMMQKVASYSVQCSGDVTFRNGSGFANYNDKPSIIAVGHDLSPKMEFQIFPIKGK
ncbi:MAG: hypothetical protein K9G46_04480 [Flavobacteriales bacterium]|nr:hypothetical protein [Flavobacteriales bacterium]